MNSLNSCRAIQDSASSRPRWRFTRSGIRTLPADDAHLAIAGADLLDPAGCEAAVEKVLARYGRLDMVAHTVGAFAMAPLAEATPAQWQQMFQVNLMSTLNLYRAATPPMRAAGRGSLVAIGAMAALRAPAEMAAYAAAKGAV
ncbi:MAG TPA: SDR family NAD(P)-dependent oxidoreductase [Falsiroseomonas sp.]|nr:SDR family NAD(P)-dependent oxidoreductase [Falsiroseomonas sp.]